MTNDTHPVKPTGRRRRPWVAVTGPDHGGWLAWAFTALAVRRAGGRPVRISPSHANRCGRFDALIVGGGADVDPSMYGYSPGPELRHIKATERRLSQLFPSTLADGFSRSLIDAVVPCHAGTTTMAIAT